MKQLDQIMPQYKDGDYYADLWKSVSRDLVAHYGEDLYKSWFSKISFFEAIGGNEIILSAPSNFIRDWIKSNYFDIISKLLLHHDTEVKSVDIITKELPKSDVVVISPNTLSLIDQSDVKEDTTSSLDPRFTFDNFVVGPPNELAYAASLSVAEAECAIAKSNPLFLYGGVGLGKTHLMHAIAWHANKKNPNRKVLYMSAEKFMYRFIKALRNKDIMSFKEGIAYNKIEKITVIYINIKKKVKLHNVEKEIKNACICKNERDTSYCTFIVTIRFCIYI